MEISEFTKTIERVANQYAEKYDVAYDPDWFLLKLQEEFGELVQAHLIMTNRTRRKPESVEQARAALAEEIADVFSYIILFARQLNIDPEQAVKDKWFAYLENNHAPAA